MSDTVEAFLWGAGLVYMAFVVIGAWPAHRAEVRQRRARRAYRRLTKYSPQAPAVVPPPEAMPPHLRQAAHAEAVAASEVPYAQPPVHCPGCTCDQTAAESGVASAG